MTLWKWRNLPSQRVLGQCSLIILLIKKICSCLGCQNRYQIMDMYPISNRNIGSLNIRISDFSGFRIGFGYRTFGLSGIGLLDIRSGISKLPELSDFFNFLLI